MLLKELTFISKLIDYINVFKVLDIYRSMCKCTGGDTRGRIGLVGNISFSLKIFLVWNTVLCPRYEMAEGHIEFTLSVCKRVCVCVFQNRFRAIT